MFGQRGQKLRVALAMVLPFATGQTVLLCHASADEEVVEAAREAAMHEAPAPVEPKAAPGRGHRPPIIRRTGKAPDEHAEHEEHVPHPKNAVGLGFAYAAHFLREGVEEEGHHASSPVSLSGFSLFYERVFIPGHLGLSIRKPFLFSHKSEAFDSPIDVVLEGLFHRNHWELFLGVGLSLNLRVFKGELEGDPDDIDVSLGIPVITGVNVLLTHDWALQAEVGYAWIATDDPVKHELTTLLTALYLF